MCSIEEYLSLADIRKGDILDVASDMLSIAVFFKRKGIPFSADNLLDALKEAVSEEGTILVRTFNWDFCHDIPFDYNKTPSKVGSLGNVALKRKDFSRTRHPLYSWMVWGKDREYLCGLDNKKSFGEGTPWEYFEREGARMLCLGNMYVPGMTCLHHVEQGLGVDYRYEKTFRGMYIDQNGVSSLREYSMFVRRLELDIIFNFHCVDRLKEKGIMKSFLYDNQLEIATADLRSTYQLIREDFASGCREEWTTVQER